MFCSVELRYFIIGNFFFEEWVLGDNALGFFKSLNITKDYSTNSWFARSRSYKVTFIIIFIEIFSMCGEVHFYLCQRFLIRKFENKHDTKFFAKLHIIC